MKKKDDTTTNPFADSVAGPLFKVGRDMLVLSTLAVLGTVAAVGAVCEQVAEQFKEQNKK